LKRYPATRHIPVDLITTDEERERGLRMGSHRGADQTGGKPEGSARSVFQDQAFIEPRTQEPFGREFMMKLLRNKSWNSLQRTPVQINAGRDRQRSAGSPEGRAF